MSDFIDSEDQKKKKREKKKREDKHPGSPLSEAAGKAVGLISEQPEPTV